MPFCHGRELRRAPGCGRMLLQNAAWRAERAERYNGHYEDRLHMRQLPSAGWPPSLRPELGMVESTQYSIEQEPIHEYLYHNVHRRPF